MWTLPHPPLTASAIEVINVDGQDSLSVASTSLNSNGSLKGNSVQEKSVLTLFFATSEIIKYLARCSARCSHNMARCWLSLE